MKIAETSDTRLVLRQRPWAMIALMLVFALTLLWASLISDGPEGPALRGLVALFGLGLLWVAHRYFPLTDTVFDRPTGLVIHAHRRLTGQTLQSWPLAEVAGAEVEANWSDESRSTRLTLRIKGERVPLETGYGPRDRRAVETAINEWLTRPTA